MATPNPNCPSCRGQGFYFEGGVFEGQMMGGNVDCPCTRPKKEETPGEIMLNLLGLLALAAGIVYVALRAKGVG